MVWAGSPLFEGQCSTVELFRFARRAKPLPDRRQIGECSGDIVAPASARPLENAQGISEEALSFFPALALARVKPDDRAVLRRQLGWCTCKRLRVRLAAVPGLTHRGKPTPADEAAGHDPQLDRALEILRT